ncbi:replicative DNA helicase [Actinobacteria bacterium IMCC26256]|nr:replicative DNA helicase [Actinobacteria bacterium IMCC26256]
MAQNDVSNQRKVLGEIVVQSIDDARRSQRSVSAGRVPPHNLEAEESLIGAMMLSRDAITAAVEARVDESDFYKPAHAHIYTAVMALYSQGEPVDPVTIAEELRRADLLEALGGRQKLVSIQANTPASSNAGHYAGIVSELALLRRLITVAGEIAESAYSQPDDVTDTVDRAEARIFEIAEKRVAESMVRVFDSVSETIEQLSNMYEGPEGAVTGSPTGYTDLDELLLGFQNSTLLIVAARPGMGKTSFALGAAANVAIVTKRPVIFFSMEMGTVELTKRLLASEARVEARKLQTGRLNDADWTRLNTAMSHLGESPLYIDDNPHCTVMEMRAKARRIKARHGDLGLIVVDYLQLMSTPGRPESRQVEVADLSRGLKILARELDCPVVALAQLNRQLEYRQDKRPMLADLRESGSIEQDADVVMFIYRDESYNTETDQRGTAEIIVAKHRNGPTGNVRLAFLDHFTKFSNMARE